jgi:hypothetical protein
LIPRSTVLVPLLGDTNIMEMRNLQVQVVS